MSSAGDSPSQIAAEQLDQAVEHHLAGRMELAGRLYRAVLALSPDSAQAHGNLGHVLLRQGQLADAIAHLQRAVTISPNYAAAHNNLGTALRERGQGEAARAHFALAVAAEPGHAAARYNLAQALLAEGQLDEALPHYQAALSLHPPLAAQRAHGAFENNLGVALLHRGRLGAAAAHLRRAVACDPAYVIAHKNLGAVHLRAGEVAAAMASYERARAAAAPAVDRQAEDLLLLLTHYDDALCSPEESAARHLADGRRLAEAAPPPRPYEVSRDSERRLRVGYVSANLHQHAVAFFFEPLLRAHDRRQVEVFCYSNSGYEDAVTARLRAGADGFRQLQELDDEAAERLIRQDRIDVLVDLSGHTDGNRLPLFSRRPAPVQVTYLGYPGTTGLPALDARLTDAWADPPGLSDALHSERLLRLPQGFDCYQPPADAPEVAEPPSRAAGHVTFASFNVLCKTTPAVIATFAEVLRAVPGSRLLLKTATLGDEAVRGRVLAAFLAEGVGPERLELLDFAASSREHLACYHRADIALDTFPYNGTTTTCDALWMGVPVIALSGRVHAGRVAVSLLSRVGLPECLAATRREYVALAAALAADPARLLALRRELRPRMARSPLCDAPLLARSIEAAYRDLWRTFCAKAR